MGKSTINDHFLELPEGNYGKSMNIRIQYKWPWFSHHSSINGHNYGENHYIITMDNKLDGHGFNVFVYQMRGFNMIQP